MPIEPKSGTAFWFEFAHGMNRCMLAGITAIRRGKLKDVSTNRSGPISLARASSQV